jgi:hypothetical protein
MTVLCWAGAGGAEEKIRLWVLDLVLDLDLDLVLGGEKRIDR